MLKVGDKAPSFELLDQNGSLHKLSDYSGKKLILYFYPKDNTSGCTKQAVAYSAKVEEFKAKGITVIGVSKDSVASHKKFEANHDLKITLLSDESRKTIEDYDVWQEKKMCGKVSMGVVRTTYIIDGNGTIIFANGKVSAAEDADKMINL